MLTVDGTTVKLTNEKISTGVTPYAVDVERRQVGGNRQHRRQMVGLVGEPRARRQRTLVDVSQRPFRAAQQISVPNTPEGVAISPDGRYIAVSSMAGSNLTPDNPGRNKLGKVSLFEIKDGAAVKVNEATGGEAAQGVVFTQDSRYLLLQMDVERALAVYAIRDGKLVDTGERIKLAAGPVSIRSMPR